MLIVGVPAEAVATWTGDGGAVTSVSEPANWGDPDNAVLQGLADGTTKATFATGGSVATLGAGDFLLLSGLTFSADTFTFDAEEGAQPVGVGAEGIVAAGAAAASALTMNWPLKITANQVWNVGANRTLDLNAPISGGGDVFSKGAGRINFNAASTYAGDIALSNGTYYIQADNATGAAGGTTYMDVGHTTVHFGTGTHDRPFVARQTSNNQYPYIRFDPNSTVVFNRSFTRNGYVTMDIGAGTELVFRDGVCFSQICKFTGTGHVVVTNRPLEVGDRLYMQDTGGITLDLWAPTNKINGNVGEQRFGRMNTRVPNALVSVVNGAVQRLNIKNDFILDLCGNDQEIGLLGGGGGTIRSDTPALLHYVADWSYTEGQIPSHGTNRTAFVGCAGFSKEGTKVPYFLDQTCSTTGTLQVVAGDLTMLPAAFWPNSTNVVVTGGTLHLTHADTFGKQANLTVTGGMIEIPAGVVQKCHYLTVGDNVHRSGTWGSSSSCATNKDDVHFSGAGIVLVYGEGNGTILIMR